MDPLTSQEKTDYIALCLADSANIKTEFVEYMSENSISTPTVLVLETWLAIVLAANQTTWENTLAWIRALLKANEGSGGGGD